ncbi:hypothetical protein HYV79_03490 [Candidatus Woesearchaeota archaeon]|nr:hypothetical protein [Candidatus Woesearchaeota archaeon]
MSFQNTLQKIMKTYTQKTKLNTSENTDIVQNLEELATREHEEFVNFINPDKKKISLPILEQYYLTAINFLSEKLSKKQKKILENKHMLKAVNERMNELSDKCQETKDKLTMAERVYDEHLQQVTDCRINTLEWSDFSEQFTQTIEKGTNELEKKKQTLELALSKKQVEKARNLRKEIIDLDRSLRIVEKERNTCAIKSVSSYRAFTFMHICYAKSKIYYNLLHQHSIVLEQLTTYLKTRLDEYRLAGNLFEFAEYFELKKELEKVSNALDLHFKESFPHLQKLELEFQKIKESKDIGKIVSSSKNADQKLYEYSLKVKEDLLKKTV